MSNLPQMKERYNYRYQIEKWGKAVIDELREDRLPTGDIQVRGNHGYADELFIASILTNDEGQIVSVLLLDTVSGATPTREMLTMIRDQCNHQLQHHNPPTHAQVLAAQEKRGTS